MTKPSKRKLKFRTKENAKTSKKNRHWHTKENCYKLRSRMCQENSRLGLKTIGYQQEKQNKKHIKTGCNFVLKVIELRVNART